MYTLHVCFGKAFQNVRIIWLAFSVEFAVKSFEGNFLFTISAVLNSIVQIPAYL